MALVDRLAALIAAQHCIKPNQKRNKQGIPINKQTIKPAIVIPPAGRFMNMINPCVVHL